MSVPFTEHNKIDKRNEQPNDTPAPPDQSDEIEARIATDTNLVLGCAAAIGLFAVIVLIAYLWTL